MQPIEIKQEVLDLLYNLDVCKHNGDSVTIRCPCCGDSRRSRTSAHFSIKIDLDDDEMPLIFHCFRCDVSGILNSDILREIGIYDIQLNANVKAYNKNAIKNNKSMAFIKYTEKHNVMLCIPSNIELANLKKKYFENRLGIETTFEELTLLKIVCNFSDFIRANKESIQKLTVKPAYASILHYNYIGFIASQNDFIQLRDISGKQDKRYYNYNVFSSIDTTRNFYAIPNKVDIMQAEPIEIVLTEGAFDVLGLFYHVYNKDLGNKIYAAVCGCGFESVIKYYLRKGIVGHNVNISIFSDQDRSPSFYSKLYEELIPWVNSIKLYYNTLSKDCGVPKDQIEIISKKIPRLKK